MNIQKFKEDYGFATDQGTNVIGFFVLILGMVNDLPDSDSLWKKILMTASIFGIVGSLWLIKGSGLHHTEGKAIREEVLNKELPDDISDEDLLDEGRE